MRIDLHCHTKKTKKGDAYTRNVTPEKFRQSMIEANIGIVAITNHNLFDIEQYLELVKITRGITQVWPGVELDVLGKKQGHVIVISNPKYVTEFDKDLSQLLKKQSPDDVLLTIEELQQFICKIDCIVIAHYYKQKALDYEDIQIVKNSIDSYRFFYEPSDYRSLGVFINHNMSSLIGSDVQDWDKYSESTFADIRLDVDSFEQFLLLSRKDSSIVNTLLNKKNKTTIDIGFKGKGKEKKYSVVENVDIYNDVNIVFGTKGTGKSKVLEQIRAYYSEKNIPYAYYSPSNNDDEIKSKLSISDVERKLKFYSFDNERLLFSRIASYTDSSITSLLDYRSFVETRNKNANKVKMKILNALNLKPINEYILKKVKSKEDDIKIIYKKIENIEVDKYLTDQEIVELNALINKIAIGIDDDYVGTWIDFESTRLANKMLTSLKDIADRNTETKAKPGTSGLYSFINKRLEAALDLKIIEAGFQRRFSSKSTYVGDLEEGKKLFIIQKAEMLNSDTRADDISGKITELREAQKLLKKMNDNVFSMMFEEYISKFSEYIADKPINSLDDFLAVKKYFALSDGEEAAEYVPSTGEATMILLQEKLEQDVSVFILDEPEKSLGNTYVNDVIVPIIISLAKQNKVVVIATHNANIAVRTLPYNSILKKYSSAQYKTYIGNPYTNKLIQYSDTSEFLDWKQESIRILEGGKEAFDERGQIYYER